MKRLNVKDLNLMIEKKQKKRKECFEKILSQCYGRIQVFADKEQNECLYEVPEFMYGYPLYKMNECIQFLYDSLSKNGFTIDYYFPRVLHIVWKKKGEAKHVRQLKQPIKLDLSNKKKSEFIESVKSYKPSGKFVLELT